MVPQFLGELLRCFWWEKRVTSNFHALVVPKFWTSTRKRQISEIDALVRLDQEDSEEESYGLGEYEWCQITQRDQETVAGALRGEMVA